MKRIEEYARWFESQPEDVRESLGRYEPLGLYRLKATGQLVAVLSCNEPEEPGGPVAMRVVVIGDAD